MIIVKISGGLGNQMFQYALGRSVSIKNNTELKLDISHYCDSKNREFSLNKLNISLNIVSPKELSHVDFPVKGLIKNVKKKIVKPYRKEIQYYVENEKFVFDPHVFTDLNNIYFDGSWQNPNYFKDIREFLLPDFSLKNKLVDEIFDNICKSNSNSVAIHFRRGDYIANPKTNKVHGTCPFDYYNRAICKISSFIKNPFFVIFSDDIEWVKTNFCLEYDHVYIDSKFQLDDTEELSLMRLCHNHIIANSTFSWWGAWLSQNESKMVVCPNKWTNIEKYKTENIMPQEWISL